MKTKKILGVLTIASMTTNLIKNRISEDDVISKIVVKTYATLTNNTKLIKLSSIFNTYSYAVIIDNTQNNQNIVGILTRTHLLKYVTSGK